MLSVEPALISLKTVTDQPELVRYLVNCSIMHSQYYNIENMHNMTLANNQIPSRGLQLLISCGTPLDTV